MRTSNREVSKINIKKWDRRKYSAARKTGRSAGGSEMRAKEKEAIKGFWGGGQGEKGIYR